jgi:DNA polymerase-3 subunit beta
MCDFALEAGELTRALKRVSGCVQKIPTIPALTYVRLAAEAGKITVSGTTLHMEAQAQARADVAEDGTIALHCETLLDMVKNLPKASIVSIKRDGSVAQLICGRSRSRPSVLDHEELPTLALGTGVKFKIKAADLLGLFEATHFAASRSDSKPYLLGVCLDVRNSVLSTIGSDDMRVSYAFCEAPQGLATMPRVTVPSGAVQQMMGLLASCADEVELFVSPTSLQLEGDGVSFRSQLLQGEFPDLTKVLERNVTVLFSAPAKAISEAAKRVSSVYNQHRDSKVIVPVVGFLPVEGEVQLIAGGRRMVDEATELLEAPVLKSWPEFGISPDFLTQGLSLFGDAAVEVCLNDSGSTILLRSPERPNVLHFIGTMRR